MISNSYVQPYLTDISNFNETKLNGNDKINSGND